MKILNFCIADDEKELGLKQIKLKRMIWDIFQSFHLIASPGSLNLFGEIMSKDIYVKMPRSFHVLQNDKQKSNQDASHETSLACHVSSYKLPFGKVSNVFGGRFHRNAKRQTSYIEMQNKNKF